MDAGLFTAMIPDKNRMDRMKSTMRQIPGEIALGLNSCKIALGLNPF